MPNVDQPPSRSKARKQVRELVETGHLTLRKEPRILSAKEVAHQHRVAHQIGDVPHYKLARTCEELAEALIRARTRLAEMNGHVDETVAPIDKLLRQWRGE